MEGRLLVESCCSNKSTVPSLSPHQLDSPVQRPVHLTCPRDELLLLLLLLALLLLAVEVVPPFPHGAGMANSAW